MNENTINELIAVWLTAALLIRQALGLVVVREKIRQVVCKGTRTLGINALADLAKSARIVTWVDRNIFEVFMVVFLGVLMLIGVLFLLFENSQQSFVEAKAVSAVVVVVAIAVAGIRIAIERVKTHLECD